MEYKLNQCVWELTTACNLRCRHCGSKAGIARDNELTLEECYKVIDDLAYLKCRKASLIGGEVLLCEHWHIVARELIKRGIETAIITNGFSVGSREMKKIRASGVKHVCVSVDGTEKTHDYIRGKGSYSSCMELIDTLKRKGYVTTVITTVSNRNIDEMEHLALILSHCRIDAWQIQLCAPFGRACDMASSVPDGQKILKLLDFVVEKRNSMRFLILAADNLGYFTEHESSIRSPLDRKGRFAGCTAGIQVIGIDSVGNVRGCEALYDERFIEGNVRDASIVDIWNSGDSFTYNRKFDLSMLGGKCSSCDLGSLCQGGCRSMNYFSHGKLYESILCAKPTRSRLRCPAW